MAMPTANLQAASVVHGHPGRSSLAHTCHSARSHIHRMKGQIGAINHLLGSVLCTASIKVENCLLCVTAIYPIIGLFLGESASLSSFFSFFNSLFS